MDGSFILHSQVLLSTGASPRHQLDLSSSADMASVLSRTNPHIPSNSNRSSPTSGNVPLWLLAVCAGKPALLK